MNPNRPASAYVHGNGAVVIVPGRIAALLDKLVDLTRLRIDVRGQDPELDNVLVALRVAALAWRASVGGHTERTTPDPMPAWITTGQTADLLGVDPRHVRRLAAGGRLAGRQLPHGAWLIERESAEHYRAVRHRAA
ncbi:helix-turn-helix domain-containing protein [Yinghuangia seranimata]|uniref:helix-turn-helix domain-containing protein n=1 Tax=Yinghuangia seranimata TaxID=408067 RepID=UPI00248B7686|nr:helix-turn-helix domain-containing protein [Yinghuangia seranimata]MDI2127949.1 helix-turn-helix domain-containing protein [Yinghuangia seranimata]